MTCDASYAAETCAWVMSVRLLCSICGRHCLDCQHGSGSSGASACVEDCALWPGELMDCETEICEGAADSEVKYEVQPSRCLTFSVEPTRVVSLPCTPLQSRSCHALPTCSP